MDEANPPAPPPSRRGLTRRRLLQAGGLVGVGLAGGRLLAAEPAGDGDVRPSPQQAPPSEAPPARAVTTELATVSDVVTGASAWSDPATWGGTVPGPADVARIDRVVLLDVDATVAGVRIEPAGALVFPPSASRSLETTGNVVVLGRLEMRPSAAPVVHRLAFAGVNEASFVGGGVAVLPTDVGLWVMDQGVLDLAGTAKLGWARAAAAVQEGAATVDVAEDPTGWAVGDRIVLTPTASPTVGGHAEAYDDVTIAAIAGRRVTLASPTRFAHPAVEVAPGRRFTAEILNLTRNVRIEGGPAGRSHVFVHSTRPQTVKHAALAHLGPRRGAGEAATFVPGRYAVHFHLAEEGSRGSVIEGTVAHDCGSHVFVSHFSHGITWRDCVSHQTLEEPYWWDPRSETEPALPANDIIYDRCVASLVQSGSNQRFRLSGFFLGAGSGSIARGCVAVGVLGKSDGSGFHWPSASRGLWVFEDCVGHNMQRNGIFVWQNTPDAHVVTRFVGYHNGGFGIHHGAYLNRYEYRDAVLYGNLDGALNIKAMSNAKAGALRFVGVRCDGAGLSDFAVVIDNHILPSKLPAVLSRCSFTGYRIAAVRFAGGGKGDPHLFDLVDCTYDGTAFRLDDGVPAASVIRVQDVVHGSVALVPSGSSGTRRPEWNAWVAPIARFAAGN